MQPDSISRFAPLLGPLALTALSAAGVVLRWGPFVAIGLLLLTAAAWVAAVIWVTRRTGAPVDQQKIIDEQQALLDQLRGYVAREVAGANLELERSRKLIREAVGQLDGSFRSMEEQSRQQRETIRSLVEADGAGSSGVRQFADAAGQLMGDLTLVLADDSRESVRTVQTIDEMVQHLDSIFDHLHDLKLMGDQAAHVAASATDQAAAADGDPRRALALMADEVRNLSERSASFNDRIRSLVNNAKAVVGRVRIRVEDTAEREMNTSIQAKTRSDGLIEQVTAINRSLAAGMRSVSDCGNQIHEDVASAVRCLQFEDITAQALSAASVHLGRLEAINKEATKLQQVLSEMGPEASNEQLHAIEELGRKLKDQRGAWDKPAHKPVSQNSMKPGSVELF